MCCGLNEIQAWFSSILGEIRPSYSTNPCRLPSCNITLFFISIRVIDNARNEVRNEEGCGAINPCCSGVACCWSDSRGAAAEESPTDRLSIAERCSYRVHSFRANSAGSARAWLHRRTEHLLRVPICGGKGRSVP